MGLFVDARKLQAAARSMHQFTPVVREAFPAALEEPVVEAMTVFLYLRCAREVFGRGFVERLRPLLLEDLRHAAEGDVQDRMVHIARTIETCEREPDPFLPPNVRVSTYERSVRDHIRAMFSETGIEVNGALVRDMFVVYEQLVQRLRAHLEGIRKQNHFLLR